MLQSELAFLQSNGLELLLKVFAAVIAGALLGHERQRKGKPVGMLTGTIVALGTMLFIQAGIMISGSSAEGTDATRVASLIVTGIGFIGAGTIMRSQYNVTGLASAATIWAVGGLAVIVAWGYLLTAMMLTVLVYMLLRMIPLIEHHLFDQRFCLHADFVIDADRIGDTLEYLREHQVSLADVRLQESDGQHVLSVDECGHEAPRGMLGAVRALDGVSEVRDRRDLRHLRLRA